jgi:competence protein ComEC
LISTHWHGDHFGGMADVASRIPIHNFVDHGPNIQPQNARTDEFMNKTYPALYAEAKHTVVKPGDKIPMRGLDWTHREFGGRSDQEPAPRRWRAEP